MVPWADNDPRPFVIRLTVGLRVNAISQPSDEIVGELKSIGIGAVNEISRDSDDLGKRIERYGKILHCRAFGSPLSASQMDVGEMKNACRWK